MAEIYGMKDLSELLDQSRIQVRRKIEKLNIKAINEDTREYATEPLQYDYDTYLRLAKEFNVPINETENEQASTTNVQGSTSDVQVDKGNNDREIIEILERELQGYKKIVDKKDEQIKELNKLLDQQQQLTLMFNTEVEKLNLKVQELVEQENEEQIKKTEDEQASTTNVQGSTSDVQAENKRKWWKFW
ncbi:DUF536 domain-containing protein [Phocicoccus pinnipedialis]|uniref:Regulator of chromosome segregation-like C-terminal domain-containing protein n=1 Tax=Phocicoccus pinnipedialis TaxID=110845 RepID=A0A6V7RMT2_9BACL|nr:DUF536 domain-containing protein [Jeotgalicoccus pinnipedialis]MBP1940267.1 vacuolar-type H+-ATPase subunit I/STV1 [Jeotgalicoccus pinnipedialis]CAD2079712.1 hypothetical protein JEOPIN946_01605 [Jeotgalicoccus pinnipedialis]